MFTCIAFIFASIVELAFIAYQVSARAPFLCRVQDKKVALRSLKFDWSWRSVLYCKCVFTDPQAAVYEVGEQHVPKVPG